MRRVCCGCQEAPGVVREPGLGWVCASCSEVIDIVFAVEIKRCREACRKLWMVIEALEAGRL